MFFAYFALWVILNGRWTAEIGAFGVVFAALAYAFSCAFLGFSPRRDFHLMRALHRAISYGVLLLGEIIRANFAVMRIILNPACEVKPKLVRFESGLKSESLRVVLADSITLTPGTITCQLRGDEYVVHCLDESMAVGLTDGPLISALRAMHSAQPKTAHRAERARCEQGEEEQGEQAKARDEEAQSDV